MRILHYSLGFPSYRSGGLTKYCCDLMLSQISRDHEVALVWPGRMGGRFSFRRGIPWNGVASFEMINPLPVPYDEGVVDPAPYLESRNANVCETFLKEFSPDVLHVHSTMGLPFELVEMAAVLGARTIFTTHDYYPLCPKVTMFREGRACNTGGECEDCPICNIGGLSMGKMHALQSPTYRVLKDSVVARRLRARHRTARGRARPAHSLEPKVGADAYRELLRRNLALLRRFNIIHANSTLAAGIYGSYLERSSLYVVPIGNAETQTMHHHGDLSVGNPVRLGYFGAASAAKGYYLLLDTLRRLWDEGLRFELNLYGPIDCSEPFVRVHPRYGYGEIDAVYQATDLALVPSLWPETFGFQATEALCRGVPVLVSSMVGMKDVLGEDMGVVCDPTSEALATALRKCLTPGRIPYMRKAIAQGFVPPKLELVEDLYLREGAG